MANNDDSQIPPSCDWSTFSCEQVLASRKDSANAYFESIQQKCIPIKEGKYNELRNKIADSHSKYCELKEDHYGILKEYEERLRLERTTFKEKYNREKSDSKLLADKLDNLEKEKSKLSADYKLQKEAYLKALRMYSTYFDCNVSIEECSEDLVVASVSFGFSKDLEPIKVVVDRNGRKITEIDPKRLPMEKKLDENIPAPEFLSYLREAILNVAQ